MNKIPEIKNALEGINNRLDEAEDQISNSEEKGAENTQSEQHKEKELLKMRMVYGPVRQCRESHIHIIKVQEGKDRARD